MSTREGSPYNDKITDDGKAIVYEGHDVSKRYIDNNLINDLKIGENILLD